MSAPLLRFRARFLFAALLSLAHSLAYAASGAPHPDLGHLDFYREHARWPKPEALVAQLRSSDDTVRLKALHLVGVPDEYATRSVWSRESPSKAIGSRVVTPDQVQLTYAALGEDQTQQAIVALQEGNMTYAAVGLPNSQGWTRIGAFSCWCKYEEDPYLHEFLRLRPAPSPKVLPRLFELVLRASGGGTGVYTQTEAHFRVFHGELRPVLSFVSSYYNGTPTRYYRKRWFSQAALGSEWGGMLVEGRARDSTLHLRATSCRFYRWDEQRFTYIPSAARRVLPKNDSAVDDEMASKCLSVFWEAVGK